MKKKQQSKFLKATTAAAVAASVVAVAAPIAPEASTFKDVPSSHQFFDAIKSLSDRGIINGYQDGTFKPGQNLTRGQAAKIIAGVLGLDTTNVINPNFKDIPTTHQYYGAIAALKQAGIIDGYEDGTFRQGANIQRNHVAKIIANALNLKSKNADVLPFTDVRADYKEAITALYENNVTTGKTASKFDGSSNVTRGQMAAFITRAEAVVKTTPETSKSVTFKLDDYTTASIVVDGTTYSYDDSVKSIFTEDNKEALSGASIVATVTNGVVTYVNSLTLNNEGTTDQGVVFNSNATIDALTINADFVTVSGLTVTGNATVTTNVGNSVELDGTTVNGDLIIDDAIFGKVASLDNKFANDEKKGPKVKLRGSKAGKVHVKRNDTAIESDSVVTEITVAATVSLINLDGTVTKVTVESTTNLELKGNANIGQVLLTTAVELALQIKGIVETLAVSNPAAKITVGTDLKINELTVPVGTTVAGIVSNYAAIASQIVNVIVGTPSTGTPGTGGVTPNPTPTEDNGNWNPVTPPVINPEPIPEPKPDPEVSKDVLFKDLNSSKTQGTGLGTDVNSFLITDLEGATNSNTIKIELSDGTQYEFKQSSVNEDRYLVELPTGVDLSSSKIIIE
ncbi:S-layer homology domain-containing protein [Solibacillus sp. FSL W7-1324]|uniref:S-layer homology domain-containing protein n=1 Tax=Solibacillus sp. FSL W7-1324 TaxID=2921701 RepID=UPI0030FB0548